MASGVCSGVSHPCVRTDGAGSESEVIKGKPSHFSIMDCKTRAEFLFSIDGKSTQSISVLWLQGRNRIPYPSVEYLPRN